MTNMPRYLQPFNETELAAAQIEVARLVRALQGRKLEEGDWTDLYCKVKGAPRPGWSNLPFRDYLHEGRGVEFKLLCRKSPADDMGRSLMHPSATRTIDFQETDSAENAMTAVLTQWGEQIADFERRIRATSIRGTVDARWGVLLWAPDHSQFLYFEERLEKPDPAQYVGKWVESTHRGKPTRNLHIFERATGKKRFSCTLPRNGAKLQPYFDVPTVAQGAILFTPPPHRVVPFYVESDDLARARALFPNTADEDIMAQLLASYLEHQAHRR